MKKILLNTLLITFVFAGGWNLKKGQLFTKYEFRWINATEGFNVAGDTFPLGFDYSSNTHSLYTEYGLLDHLTLISNIPFAKSYDLFGGISTSGFGDINLGARYGFDQDGSTVMALIINTNLETGEIAKLTSIGGSAIQLGIEIGHSLHKIGAYTTAYVAFNSRSGSGIQNELNIGAEFGYKLTDDLWGILKLRNVMALDDLTAGIPAQFQSEYFAFSVEAAYNLNKAVGITAAFDGALSAKNNFSAPTIAVGIFYKSL